MVLLALVSSDCVLNGESSLWGYGGMHYPKISNSRWACSALRLSPTACSHYWGTSCTTWTTPSGLLSVGCSQSSSQSTLVKASMPTASQGWNLHVDNNNIIHCPKPMHVDDLTWTEEAPSGGSCRPSILDSLPSSSWKPCITKSRRKTRRENDTTFYTPYWVFFLTVETPIKDPLRKGQPLIKDTLQWYL